MKIKILLLLGGIYLSSPIMAQGLQIQDKPLPCIEKTFSVVVHIPKDTLGDIYIREDQVQDAIDTMNVYFAPICARFELCEFNVIENFQYSIPANTNEWEQMKVKYQQNNRINVFIVLSIPWVPFDCGYTDLGGLEFPQRDALMLKLICLTDLPKSLSHEMGHYFGLLDTYGTENTPPELVDGSNCETAGDLICDTPADPFVPGDTLSPKYLHADIPCRFVFEGEDPAGQYYTPDVGNMMTLYPDTCRCGFTQQQFHKMVDIYRTSMGSW
ncbi:MAG: hypothetical protein KTR30_18525 [Saprospiraceae bacterium]|nr:hypothetical protein [Saprospiraceae bacterium]